MLGGAIARRYAAAFFEVARERNELEEIQEELRSVVRAMESYPELRKALYHRLISPDEKMKLVDRVVPGLSPATRSFLELVIRKGRVRNLDAIYAAFAVLADRAMNMVEAEVTSAVELSHEQLQALRARLASATGKRVRLRTMVDPDLLGGVVLKIGDRLMDGSIKKRLARLEASLLRDY